MKKRQAALVTMIMVAAVAASAQMPTPKRPFSAEYVYTENGQPMQGMSPMKVAATAKRGFCRFRFPWNYPRAATGCGISDDGDAR